jgi:hypothetical protein
MHRLLHVLHACSMVTLQDLHITTTCDQLHAFISTCRNKPSPHQAAAASPSFNNKRLKEAHLKLLTDPSTAVVAAAQRLWALTQQV